MLSLRAVVLLSGAAYAAAPPPALQVLRVSPRGSASPTATITVTFERPATGSLDRTIDPATIFRLDPAVRAEGHRGRVSQVRIEVE